MTTEWHKGDTSVLRGSKRIQTPGPVLWLCELPGDRFCVVTIFDEETPIDCTNAFVCQGNGEVETELRLGEVASPVRALGCYVEEDSLVLNAVNDTEYVLAMDDWSLRGTRHYR